MPTKAWYQRLRQATIRGRGQKSLHFISFDLPSSLPMTRFVDKVPEVCVFAFTVVNTTALVSQVLPAGHQDRRDGVARRARATAAATHMFFVSVAAMVPVMFSFLMTPLLQRLEAKEDDDAMVDVNVPHQHVKDVFGVLCFGKG